MYGMSAFDVVVPELGKRQELTPDEAFRKAADAFVEDKPELMFIGIGTPDHGGVNYGHGCVRTGIGAIGTLIILRN